jgi:hypothetical protein
LNNFDKLIKEIQKTLFCPECKKRFNLKNIKLRGFFDETYILETRCENDHESLLAVFITQKKSKTNKLAPMSVNDGVKFKKYLKNFNGNFKSVFNKHGEKNENNRT